MYTNDEQAPQAIDPMQRRDAIARGLLAIAAAVMAATASLPTAGAADGADIRASASIVHIPDLGGTGPGTVSCFGGMENIGNAPVTASIGISCPLMSGGMWTCSASGGASCVSTGGGAGTTTWMPPGASIGFMAGRAGQTGTHTVSVSTSAQGDVDPSNNTATASVNVVVPPRPVADLSSMVRSYPRYAEFGETVDYEFEIENHGPNDVARGTGTNFLVEFLHLHFPASASCNALTAGAQCEVVWVGSSASEYRLGLPVGARVLVRLRATTMPPDFFPVYWPYDDGTVTTRFAFSIDDPNFSNNQSSVKTQFVMFRQGFESPDALKDRRFADDAQRE